MTQTEQIHIFQANQVRTVWDDEKEEWYFSIVDVVAVLTDSTNPTDYLKKMRKREPELGLFLGTNCPQVMMTGASGRKRLTLAGTPKEVFRVIQSIPSKKAEPFKQWMAQVAADRLSQMQDPELNFEQAYEDYRRLGYSDKWINQRLKSIEIRKALTDEWDRAGVKQGQQYATLTDIITREWSGKTTKQYKNYKGLKKESLRDNMTNMELALNILAEASTAEISKARNPRGFKQSAEIAHKGGQIAGGARKQLEQQIGHTIISSEKASDHLPPADPCPELPENNNDKPCPS